MVQRFRFPRRALVWGGTYLLVTLLFFTWVDPSSLSMSGTRTWGMLQLVTTVGVFVVGTTAGVLYYAYNLWVPAVSVVTAFALTASVSLGHMGIHGLTPVELYLIFWPAVIVSILAIGGGEYLLRGRLAAALSTNTANSGR